MTNLYLLILLIIVLLFLLIRTTIKTITEGFANVDYYAIHMSSNQERETNIRKQERILGKTINHFEAVVGKDYVGRIGDLDPNVVDHWRHRPAELGCYLSHLMLIKQISQNPYGYSVIFEDDFSIDDKDLNSFIQSSIESLENDGRDFDVIFLGRCSDNTGTEYKGKLREIRDLDKEIVIMCAHAYVIKNSNSAKIYQNLLDANDVYDHKLNKLLKKGALKGYLTDPPMVNQQNDKLPSTIGN